MDLRRRRRADAATTTHTYAAATYEATVTAIDTFGVGSTGAFTGQTTSRNGTAAATASRTVTVTAFVGRATTLAGDIAFAAVDASHSDQSPPGEGTSVAINDASGTQAGWDVTIVASALTHTNNVDTIDAANMSLTDVGPLAPADSNVTAGETGSIGSARTLVSAAAGFGVGAYTQAFSLGLNVPGDSRSGAYSGTVTVTIAPPPDPGPRSDGPGRPGYRSLAA